MLADTFSLRFLCSQRTFYCPGKLAAHFQPKSQWIQTLVLGIRTAHPIPVDFISNPINFRGRRAADWPASSSSIQFG